MPDHRDHPLLEYLPLLGTLRSYRLAHLRSDLPAAATVALFAVPQAMAYALVAGVPPVHGLYAAIVACILGAAFGSSSYLIDGPTNAISVMLASNVALTVGQDDPIAVVLVITVITGVIQITMGLLRLGSVTRFVSVPVLHGFTAGAGLYIVANQLPALLGFPSRPDPPVILGLHLEPTCLTRVISTLTHLEQTSLAALGLGLGTFAVIRLLRIMERRTGQRIPSTLVGIVLATVVSELLDLGGGSSGLRVAVVSDIQVITRSLPEFRLPDFTLVPPTDLVGPAAAIAVLGAIEAIAIARTLADRSGESFDPNQQLLGEGMANVGTGLFSGISSSGSFTRSAVNYEAGAATRIAGVLAGIIVLVLLLALAPLANRIPIPALAGSLLHVASILINVGKIRLSMVTTRSDRAGFLVTFLAVLVLSHLEQALLLGMGVSVGLALRKAHEVEVLRLVPGRRSGFRVVPLQEEADAEEGITVLDIQGEMFFAAVDSLEARLRPYAHRKRSVLVLRLRNAMNLDASICEALGRLVSAAHNAGGSVIFSGVTPVALGILERSGLQEQVGPECVFPIEDEVYESTLHAVERARQQRRRQA